MPKQNKETLQEEQFVSPDRPYKKIALSFIILASLLTLIIVYFTLSKAVITLEPKEAPEAKNFTFNIPLNTTSTEVVLNGTLTTQEVEIVKSFEVQNFKTEPGKATGIMTITNDNDKSQTLIATTRFLAPNGLIFRLQENVTVPAKQEITATVEADQSGDKYDIAPTSFTIPGLSEALQSKIYGKTTTAMSGGVKKIGRLSTEEITAAQKTALADLDKDIKEKLSMQDDKQNITFLDKEILEENISNKEGDEVEKYTITIKVKTTIVSLDKEKLLSLTKDEYKKQMPSQTTLISYNLDSFKYTLDNLVDTTARVTTSLSAYNLKELNPQTIEKEKLYGLDKAGVKYFFDQYDNIKNVEVKFWPFWVKAVPSMADHIVIEVKN
ncbi:MAG TPA: hypothetical protein PLH37_01665 [bacterium]|nr:hypothetical protein [bacterium]